jgi:hypothetical protein
MLWGFKTNPTLPNTLDFGLVVCRKSFRFVYKLYKYSPKFSKKKKKKKHKLWERNQWPDQ